MSELKNRVIARNKKAWHDYFVNETFEAGIELSGTEVKSVRAGRVNLKDAWCGIDDGELYIYGMHISPYSRGNIYNRDPLRVRRLLVHKSEIKKLSDELKQQGLALVPLEVYFKRQYVKVQLGLCKGKKLYDKRADMADRDAKRAIDRALKENNR